MNIYPNGKKWLIFCNQIECIGKTFIPNAAYTYRRKNDRIAKTDKHKKQDG